MKKSEFKLSKILLAIVLIIATVLALIITFYAIRAVMGSNEASADIKNSMWSYLGIAIALLGSVIALLLSLLNKSNKIIPFIFIGVGIIAIIFMCISFMARDLSALKKVMDTAKKGLETAESLGIGEELVKSVYNAAAFTYYKELLTPIINMLVFGAVPIIFGLKALGNKK